MAENLWILPIILQLVIFFFMFWVFYQSFGFIIGLILSLGIAYAGYMSMQDQ